MNIAEWIAAWGYNAAMIADDYNALLPKLPEPYEWLIVRSTQTSQDVAYPKVEVRLTRINPPYVQHVDHGIIDYKMYGDRGVIELARNIRERRGLVSAP